MSASHKKKLKEVAFLYSCPRLHIDGEAYRRVESGTVAYHSLCGSVDVARAIYRQEAVRNGPTVVPMDIAAGLVEHATPALAYRIALGDAQCPGRQWEQQMLACQRKPPSRSTLERIAKKIGSAIRRSTPEILAQVRDAESVETEAVAISIGLDRTTIPMEEPLRKGDIPDPSRRRRTKPYVRRPPEPAEVHYRMGYVGTVHIAGRDSESIRTIKYACSADVDPTQLVGQALAEVVNLQEHRRSAGLEPLPIGVVQDGAPEMWRIAEDGLRTVLPGTVYYKAIDRYHLMERLAEGLKLLRVTRLEREQLLAQWRDALDTDDNAIETILERFKREARKCKAKLSRADEEIISSHETYIRNNRANMHYASIRRKGIPTGSGATEGACKSVIMIRTKGCGQRWHSPGVNAVLTLRSLWLSERLPSAWKAFQQHRLRLIKAA